MSSDVVELTNISKAYKHIYAVDHINMKIKKEIFMVLSEETVLVNPQR